MSIEIFQQIEWALVRAEYQEFCNDLDSGLLAMNSAPSSYARCLARYYLGMTREEAKRTFRSVYYCREPKRATEEWGKDEDAPLLTKQWRDFHATTDLLGDFHSPVNSRIKIRFAQKYCKYRETLSHPEALLRSFGTLHPEVEEERLRELANIQLAPSRLVIKALRGGAARFSPSVVEVSRKGNTMLLIGASEGLEWTLNCIAEDRADAGFLSELSVKGGKKGERWPATAFIANPAWDIITVESLGANLDYLICRTNMFLAAALHATNSPRSDDI